MDTLADIPKSKTKMQEYVLWKHIDHTPSEPFMTNPANPLLCHRDMFRPRSLRISAFAYQQLRLHLDVLGFLQIGRDSAFGKSGGRRPHATFEVELQFFDREGFGD